MAASQSSKEEKSSFEEDLHLKLLDLHVTPDEDDELDFSEPDFDFKVKPDEGRGRDKYKGLQYEDFMNDFGSSRCRHGCMFGLPYKHINGGVLYGRDLHAMLHLACFGTQELDQNLTPKPQRSTEIDSEIRDRLSNINLQDEHDNMAKGSHCGQSTKGKYKRNSRKAMRCIKTGEKTNNTKTKQHKKPPYAGSSKTKKRKVTD